jgi:hypothetical protein
MTLAEARLSFVTKDGPAFDVAVEELEEVRFVQLDTVLKLKVAGQRYTFQFTRPPGAEIVVAESIGGALGAVGEVAVAVRAAKGAVESRKAGKAFKAALALAAERVSAN